MNFGSLLTDCHSMWYLIVVKHYIYLIHSMAFFGGLARMWCENLLNFIQFVGPVDIPVSSRSLFFFLVVFPPVFGIFLNLLLVLQHFVAFRNFDRLVIPCKCVTKSNSIEFDKMNQIKKN